MKTALAADLDGADRLLACHLGAAIQRFGAAALSVVDLPPLRSSSIDVEQIRVAAVLLWAREVEEAGLPGFVEALAGGLVKGTLILSLTSGADRIMRYYRDREHRFGREERQAIYARVFGDPVDSLHPFSPLFEQMVQNLAEIGAAATTTSLAPFEARLRFAGRQLAELLSSSAGIAAFAARDIAANIREAVEILRDHDVAQALGGGGLWALIRVNAPTVAGRNFDSTLHLTRARAGQQILAWLADSAALFESSGNLVGRTDPIVEAAQSWQAAPGI